MPDICLKKLITSRKRQYHDTDTNGCSYIHAGKNGRRKPADQDVQANSYNAVRFVNIYKFHDKLKIGASLKKGTINERHKNLQRLLHEKE